MWSGLLRRAVDGTQPGVDYLVKHQDLVDTLVKGRVHARFQARRRLI